MITTTPRSPEDRPWDPWFQGPFGPILHSSSIHSRKVKEMKIRMFMATAAIAISGALATSAVAAELTPTQVTIKGQNGDFYGYVKSDDENHCANQRKVTLYKLTGEQPDPSEDEKIASDTASPNGNKYMWATGNTGEKNGKFYAHVKKTQYCGADNSPVINS